jgi:hypothetical protein
MGEIFGPTEGGLIIPEREIDGLPKELIVLCCLLMGYWSLLLAVLSFVFQVRTDPFEDRCGWFEPRHRISSGRLGSTDTF